MIKLREQTRILSKELEKVVAHRNTIHTQIEQNEQELKEIEEEEEEVAGEFKTH